MTKALFKKQMLEVFSWIYRNKKSGKNRSSKGIAGYALLYLLIFIFLGSMFYFVAGMLCEPLAAAGFGWLFFAIMGLIAVALGVFGSVFNTYASLYLAKDNDLLLSMPVPPSKILMVRLSGVFAMGLLYELIVLIPTLIVWFSTVPVGLAGVICTLLIPLVLSVFVLTLSAVLGWVVALISNKLKHKNILVVVLSLAFLAAYYYFYARAYAMLQSILSNPQAVGGSVKSVLYPLYHMGLAAQGRVDSMVIFTGIVGCLFGAVYLALSRSFLRLATSNRGTAKAKYKEKAARAGGVGSALLRKELRRFLGSSTYMLNCGLGTVIMIVAAAALLIKSELVTEMLYAVLGAESGIVPLIACAAVCLLTCMNVISAPSVSLEGKNLWLVQSLPVSGRQVLMAKLKLHLILTLIPAAILVASTELVLKPSVELAILFPAAVAAFILFLAAFGLFLNLNMPNLNWTDETAPVKQSMSVALSLFGGWALVAALCGLYYPAGKLMSPAVYLLLVTLVLLAVSSSLLVWLKKKGARMFEEL